MDTETKELFDKRALDELIYGAMHAMDGHDWAAYRKNLLDDAEFDFTRHGVASERAGEIMRGADYFVTVLASVLEGFDATQHHVTNLLHEIDGDTAISKSYVYAEHFLMNDRGDPSVTCGGRYVVTSQRAESGWKVAKWLYLPAWFRGNTMLYQYASDPGRRKPDRTR